MSVWFCIPSKRPLHELGEVLGAWKERGYKIAVAREVADGAPSQADLVIPVYSYQGWARSTNLLISVVMAGCQDAEWFVGGGDDYWPDPNKTAEEIAAECGEHFWNKHITNPGMKITTIAVRTFGVMQPTGDRWMDKGDGHGAVIDRIAGSPWMGREFCRRMYHGAGPLYSGFYHNFADELLQKSAQKLGVFWQRPDLFQEHRHWARRRGDWRDAPDWAYKINHPQQSDWERSKALFKNMEAAGFPEADDLLPAGGE